MQEAFSRAVEAFKEWNEPNIRSYDASLLHGGQFQFELSVAASRGLLSEFLLKAGIDSQTLELTPEGKVQLDQYYQRETEKSLPYQLRQQIQQAS